MSAIGRPRLAMAALAVHEPAELAAAFKKKDLQICQTGQPLPRIIELFPNADGEHVWYETTKVPLFDDSGRACGVCGTVRSYEGTKALLEPFLQVEAAAEFIKQNLADALNIAKLAKLGSQPIIQTTQQFAEVIKNDSAKWAEVIKAGNIKPD